MDDIKKAERDAEVETKKAARGIDGTDTSEKIANAGDEIRKDLGNAGDDIRNAVDDTADRVDQPSTDPARTLLAPRSAADSFGWRPPSWGRQPFSAFRPSRIVEDGRRVPAGRRPVGQHERRPAGHHGLQRRPTADPPSQRRGRPSARRGRGSGRRGRSRGRSPAAAARRRTEPQAVLADPRRVAVGQRVDERRELGRLERRPGPLVGQVRRRRARGCRGSSRRTGRPAASATASIARTSSAASPRTSRPPMRISPAVYASNRSRSWTSVDLPAPLGPTIASRPPARSRTTGRR